MRTTLVILLTFVLGAAIGAIGTRWPAFRQHGKVRHELSGPTLEQVRRMAELVTLHVPISDVQVSQLSGHTGSVSLVLIISGDVQVGVNLRSAEYL